MLGAVGPAGLAALVVVVAVGATAVATGRTTVPLRALGAARAAVGLSDATAPPPLPIARGQAGGALSRGGDPNASSALLEQIARCLPADERPNLASRSLVVRIDERGALRAAISANGVLAGAEERALADRVVQAALLCGPYDGPGVAGQDFSLTPDFRGVAPRGPGQRASRD